MVVALFTDQLIPNVIGIEHVIRLSRTAGRGGHRHLLAIAALVVDVADGAFVDDQAGFVRDSRLFTYQAIERVIGITNNPLTEIRRVGITERFDYPRAMAGIVEGVGVAADRSQ